MNRPQAATVAQPLEVLVLGGSQSHDRRPVHTLFCVGKNYADHAREMGSEPVRGEPIIFLKPAVSLRCGSELEFSLPAWSNEVHHEVELVALLGAGFDPSSPLSCVEAYGVGLDLTLRDLQSRAKASGSPWTASKGFPGAALLSILKPSAGIRPEELELELTVDGDRRQHGLTSQMLHDLPSLVRHLGERYGLVGGELIYTGTPAGVGPLKSGNRLNASLKALTGATIVNLSVAVR